MFGNIFRDVRLDKRVESVELSKLDSNEGVESYGSSPVSEEFLRIQHSSKNKPDQYQTEVKGVDEAQSLSRKEKHSVNDCLAAGLLDSLDS